MAKKGGLGRGLDALLGGVETEANYGVREIKINEIDTNPKQPRKDFDEQKLNELAESIRLHGIIQPLLVQKNGDRYRLIAGERRYRAARLLKLGTVPAILTELNEQQAAEVSLIENIQREDLNPIEEAAALNFLMKQHDLTQEELSARLGKSRSAIANSLRLLTLNPQIKEHLIKGNLTTGHAKMLAGVPDPARRLALAEACIKNSWSVRTLEDIIRTQTQKPAPKRKTQAQSPEIKHLIGEFRSHLGVKVEINGNEEKGKVILSYFSKEDLDNIYRGILE
ncbi:MAG: ParB/RepB/Spo0J family partition protein [Clostridia bacterium]|nr:ParB/RepB/Spo0J family partition protein [Clostridia bacterium]